MDADRHTNGLAPASREERYEFLDALRGFSLAGIVLANMISYSLYLYLSDAQKGSLTTAASDKLLDLLELIVIESKFYTIFSILFGIGFSILMTRAEAKGLVFHRFFLRRAFFLLLIGLCHAVLFWHNDILGSYAVCGALLLPFVAARSRTILATSAVALVCPLIFKAVGVLPHGTFIGPRDFLFERFGFTEAARAEIWAEGSFIDVLLLNASSWFGQIDYVLTSGMIFKIYGCFLLGLWIGRNEIHKKLEEHAVLIKRIALGGIAAGLPLNVLYAVTFESESLLHEVIATVAVLPLSAGYASLLALLWMQSGGRKLLRHFSAVGRMALTNYVAQSAISVLIFRGIGLELGGKVGPALYLPIGLGVYALQVAFSRWWLSRFQFGPLEWLWRMLTYGTSVPLKRPAVTSSVN